MESGQTTLAKKHFKVFSEVFHKKHFFSAKEEMRLERWYGCNGMTHAELLTITIFDKDQPSTTPVHAYHLNTSAFGPCNGSCKGRLSDTSWFTFDPSA